jgi:serine/threonine protein kinase
VDLWALGVLIYEMIAAITPFGLATYSQADGEEIHSQSQSQSDAPQRESVDETLEVSPRDDYSNEGKEERLQRLKASTEKVSTSELVDETSKLLATIAGTRTNGVHLPHDFSDLTAGAEVTSLILGLLHPEPAERLALQRRISANAFQHDFFIEFDWNALSELKLEAPYVPTNIEDTTESKNIPLGDCYLGDQSMFEGF